VTPAATASVTSSASAVDPFKSQLIDLLKVPAHLTAGSRDVSLRLAYQKYKAFLVASSTLDDMVAKRTWPTKRPSRTDLIELFVGKSFFHSHYRPLFTRAANYPEMVAWLEDKPGSVDVDVWGVKQDSYTFSHLSLWLDNGGGWESDNADEESKVKKKGKGKGKEKDSGKGNGKRKEKDLGEVRKHKKKESSKKAK
jgi:hypothetical protein